MAQPTTTDRALAATRALVSSFLPALKYYFVHEYSVAESDGSTFSGVPTDAMFSPAIPTRVPYSPSLAGSQCTVPSGTLAHVVFVNADPSKPRCIGFDLPSIPSSITIDSSGDINVGQDASSVNVGKTFTPALLTDAIGHFPRYGDVLQIGTTAGVLTWVSGPVTTGKT